MSKLNAPSMRGGRGRGDDRAPLATAQPAMLESADPAGAKQLDFEAWTAFLRTSCGNQPDVADPSAFAGWVRPLSVCGLDAAELQIECGFPPTELGRDAYTSAPTSGGLDPARTTDPDRREDRVESRRAADTRARVWTWASSATRSGGCR